MRRAPLLLTLLLGLTGCRNLSRFGTVAGERFEGSVVQASFVRGGVTPDTRLCLTLDAEHLQDTPGTISTSDGRFHLTPLRPIPQVWHDAISTLGFGEGRLQNLLYAAAPGDAGPGDLEDVLVVVSLLQSNDVEVRLLRGAPEGPSTPIFAVFALSRAVGPCSF